jgi:prepilin-type N-terminal cleavage/methylation domain-containing protein
MIRFPEHPSKRAFSLVELMVSAALISVMAAAIGLALNRAAERDAHNRATLKQIRQTKEILRLLQDDLRITNAVERNGDDDFALQVESDTGTLETHRYYLNNLSKVLYRRINLQMPQLIARDVYNFSIVVEKEEPIMITKLLRAQINLQIGSNPDNLMQCSIDTFNKPTITDNGM